MDLVGKTVRLPLELWEKLAERAKADERSVNYVLIQAVKAHVGKVIPDVGKVVSSQYQPGTTVIPTPDLACAREQFPREKESERERDPLLSEWLSTEPFCLLSDTAKALEQYRRMNPDVNIEAETAAIQQWWEERPPPKGKKRKKGERWFVTGIQAGIRGWLKRANDPPPSSFARAPRQATLIMEPEDEVPPAEGDDE